MQHRLKAAKQAQIPRVYRFITTGFCLPFFFSSYKALLLRRVNQLAAAHHRSSDADKIHHAFLLYTFVWRERKLRDARSG